MAHPLEAFSYRGRVFSPEVAVADDDPAVKALPHLFTEVEAPVERATARPGSKRATKRAATKPKG